MYLSINNFVKHSINLFTGSVASLQLTQRTKVAAVALAIFAGVTLCFLIWRRWDKNRRVALQGPRNERQMPAPEVNREGNEGGKLSKRGPARRALLGTDQGSRNERQMPGPEVKPEDNEGGQPPKRGPARRALLGKDQGSRNERQMPAPEVKPEDNEGGQPPKRGPARRALLGTGLSQTIVPEKAEEPKGVDKKEVKGDADNGKNTQRPSEPVLASKDALQEQTGEPQQLGNNREVKGESEPPKLFSGSDLFGSYLTNTVLPKNDEKPKGVDEKEIRSDEEKGKTNQEPSKAVLANNDAAPETRIEENLDQIKSGVPATEKKEGGISEGDVEEYMFEIPDDEITEDALAAQGINISEISFDLGEEASSSDVSGTDVKTPSKQNEIADLERAVESAKKKGIKFRHEIKDSEKGKGKYLVLHFDTPFNCKTGVAELRGKYAILPGEGDSPSKMKSIKLTPMQTMKFNDTFK